jgi:radical SAM superfamily enzyme YgiQ (UPF0313 family)
MAGLPGDTEETLAQTLEFAQRLHLDEVMFSLATPFPGTALWEAWVNKHGQPDMDCFERAFYFDEGRGEVKALFNLSNLETGVLEDFVRRAQSLFQHRKEGASFKRRYGKWIGPLAHFAYRITGGRVEKQTVKT